MIQQFLTQTIEVLFVGSIAFFTTEFIRFSMARHKVCPGQLSLFDDVLLTDSEVEQLQQPIESVEPEQPKFWESAIVPFRRPAPKLPDLSGMSIRQLKAIASRARLPKYNNCTKAQLTARLMAEVERDRLVAALGAAA